MTNPNDPASQDPAAALAAIQASRRAVHDRVASKGWRYDLAYSALMAGMVAGQVLESPFNITAPAPGALGLAVVFQGGDARPRLRSVELSPVRNRPQPAPHGRIRRRGARPHACLPQRRWRLQWTGPIAPPRPSILATA